METYPFPRYPYVGITGVMPQDSVGSIVDLLPGRVDRCPEPYDRPCCRLMSGILVSEKTLNGIPNKWPHRYPDVSKIAGLIVEDLRVLNLVHYNTKNTDLARQLVEVHEKAGIPERLDGFQLNIAWPDPREILSFLQWADRHITHGRDGQYLVLQIGSRAFEEVFNSPKVLEAYLRDYDGLIDYILLDPSGGLGQVSGAEFYRPYLEELYSEERRFGVGIAGGFGPGRLQTVSELLPEYPYLSIDAEGQLRDDQDDLDFAKALAYVAETLDIFRTAVA